MSVNTEVAGARSGVRVDPVIAGILAFFVIHMLIRIFGTSNFMVDEAETAVRTQVFELFYKVNNPPLFDWLFYGLSQLIGPTALAIQIVKTLFLTLGGVFLYLGARPGFRHRAALDAAIVSYGATAFYGWDIFQQFSHTNALVFAIGFCFWAFMRVVRSARTIDYVLLGAALGLGLLSKYLFALTFVAFVVVALRSPAYRRAILSWRMAITLLVGLVVVSPLLIGYADVADEVNAALTNRVAGDGNGPTLGSYAYFFALTAEFWLPFAAILWLCLWRWPAGAMEGSVAVSDRADAAGDDSFYPFLRDATVLMLLVVLAAVLVLGTRVNSGRYFISVLTFLPLAVFAKLDRASPFPALALHYFRRAAMTFIIGLAIVRFLIFLFTSPPFCVPRCVLFIDYSPVAERIVAEADGKQSVILSDHIHIGSNLRQLVPNSRIVMDSYTERLDLDVAGPEDRNCYLVWFKQYRTAKPETLEYALERALGRPPTVAELAAVKRVEDVTAKWQAKVLWEWGPDTIIGLATIGSASPVCAGGASDPAKNGSGPT